MRCVMNIVVPLGRASASPVVGLRAEVMSGVVVVLQYNVDETILPSCLPNAFRELGHEVRAGIIADGVHGVDTQSVNAVLLDPIERVVNEVVADLAASWAVKVEGFSPGSSVPLAEKL